MVQNIDLFKQFTKSVTGTSEAQKSAAINSATFTQMVERLKNKFINWITTSDDAKKIINILKNSLKFLSDNMADIIKWTGRIISGLIAWKAITLALKASILLTKAVSTAFFIVDMVKYVASTNGISFATAAWAVAQESVNLAMLANPIVIIIAALAALGLAIYAVYKHYKELEEIYQKSSNQAKQEQIAKETKAVDLLSL